MREVNVGKNKEQYKNEGDFLPKHNVYPALSNEKEEENCLPQ